MRTLCDVCESAAATLFCAADEAALCRACDQEVHMCNKLARRHIRVGLAEPCDVLLCDVCETAPAFFYCDIDGSSLCLQCDMIVHVGGKRSHGRFLLLRQRIEFLEDKLSDVDEFGQKPSNNRRQKPQPANLSLRANEQNDNGLSAPMIDNNDAGGKMECNLIDLNAGPQRIDCQNPANQVCFSLSQNLARELQKAYVDTKSRKKSYGEKVCRRRRL